jgi:hypothetical protein
MTDELLADERPVAPPRGEASGAVWLKRGLRAATAAALGIDAYVHGHDASYYDFPGGGVISQGNLFRLEAAAAALAIVVLLGWQQRAAWLMAFTVAASALGAVLLYTYVDVGTLGPLPNMYEPTWAVPGKQLTAGAEAAAVLTSAVGFAVSRRPSTNGRHAAAR